jgi:OMF family outer membrane factor
VNIKSVLIFAGAALALLIAGCQVDQKKEIQTYRRVIEQNVKPLEQPPPATQPLSLEEAMRIANTNNERLNISGEDYLQAIIAKRRALAGFLPTVSFVPSYLVQDKSGGGVSGTGGPTNARTHTFDAPVNGQINLFNGFRDVANLRGAEATIQQQRLNLLDAREALLLDVAQTYFRVLRAERSVVVLLNSLKVQDERVRYIVGRQQAGIARQLDVAQTQALQSSTRVTLINAQNDVRDGRAALAFLLGFKEITNPLVDTVAMPTEPPSMDEMIQLAMQHRQDLLAAEHSIEAARQNVQVAFGQYYPSIALDVNAFLKRESAPTDSQWNALLSLNLPIFSAGIIEADVRDAWSRLRQTKYAESLLRRQVKQDVETAYNDTLASVKRLSELQVQIRAAAEAYRQADQSYTVGLATNLERLTAQDQLLSAQLQYASESYDQKLFYLTLLRETGTLSDTVAPGATVLSTTEPATAPAEAITTPAAPTTRPAPTTR